MPASTMTASWRSLFSFFCLETTPSTGSRRNARLQNHAQSLIASSGKLVITDLDNDTLFNQREVRGMQLASLREMNARVERAIAGTRAAPDLTDEERRAEICALVDELEKRLVRISILKVEIKSVEAEMKRRRLPLALPADGRGLVEVSEDPDMCQYCVSHRADTEFGCCHHSGACLHCVKTMAQLDARCPNCRATNPLVTGPAAAAPMAALC